MEKELKECFDNVIKLVTDLQGVMKQHNGMFLNLYERIAALEALHEGGTHREDGDQHE